MFSAFETLLDHTPPAWMCRLEAAVLMRAFARAFDVEPPAPATLAAFREFTAACMEAASADRDIAARYRDRLGQVAYALGARVRVLLAVRPSQAFRVTRFFYRGIGIELAGCLPGGLQFGPCYFAARYTPHDCYFMSAFDEGFMRGIAGSASGALVFSSRITEGAPCCSARLQSGDCPPEETRLRPRPERGVTLPVRHDLSFSRGDSRNRKSHRENDRSCLTGSVTPNNA